MLYISMNTSSISFEKDRYLSTVSHERVMLPLLWQHRFLVIWHLSPFKLIMEEAKRPRCALCLIIWNWYQCPVSYATWCCHTRLLMSDNLIVPLTCLTVNQRSSCAKVTRQCIKYLRGAFGKSLLTMLNSGTIAPIKLKFSQVVTHNVFSVTHQFYLNSTKTVDFMVAIATPGLVTCPTLPQKA